MILFLFCDFLDGQDLWQSPQLHPPLEDFFTFLYIIKAANKTINPVIIISIPINISSYIIKLPIENTINEHPQARTHWNTNENTVSLVPNSFFIAPIVDTQGTYKSINIRNE